MDSGSGSSRIGRGVRVALLYAIGAIVLTRGVAFVVDGSTVTGFVLSTIGFLVLPVVQARVLPILKTRTAGVPWPWLVVALAVLFAFAAATRYTPAGCDARGCLVLDRWTGTVKAVRPQRPQR